MTSNNNTISVRLSADAQELQRALSQGTGYIESFAGRATGAMRDVARETGKLEGGMSGITSAAKVAAGAFAALGIGLSVGALTGWVRGAIDAADSVSKLAQKTGLAVKEVGGLQLAFRQAGVEDGLQTSLARLAKEASKGNDAFAAMSVTVKNSDGGLKSTRELMGEVADKFASYKDGAEKTALAQEIFGKSGADLIPLLNAGASALDEYDKTAAALGLTLSDETVKSAEAFNDTLDLVGQSTQGVARQVAAKLLPTLNVLATELLGAVTNTDFMTGAANALSAAFKILYTVGVGVVGAFKTVGLALGGVGAAIAAVLRGDFAQVNEIGNDMAREIGASWAESAASVKRAWVGVEDPALAAMAKMEGDAKRAREAAKQAAPVVGALTDASKAHKKAIDEANKAMAEEAKLLAELSGLSGSFYKDWQVLDTAYKKGTISLDGLLEKQAALLAKQPAMVAAAKEQIEAAKASNAAFDEQFKAVETLREATEGRIKSAREMLEAIERETSLMGLSNQEREQAIALFELERQGVVKGTEAYDAYAQKIKEAIVARSGKQATEELNKATTAEWKKTVDKYDDIFRGGFADMLNNGKGAWDSFTTSLTTTFKTSVADQIYKMFAQPFVVKFVASMLGVVGGTASGVANAASTGSSLLSGASTLSSLGSTTGLIGQFASGFSGSASAASALMGGAELTTAASMGANVSAVLTSIGPAGWAAMAVLAVAAIASGRGETRSGAAYVTGADGKAEVQSGPSGGEIEGDKIRASFNATTAGINELLKTVGSKSILTGFVAGLESSKSGKGFAYAGGMIDGKGIGANLGRTGGQFAMSDMTAEDAVKSYAAQLKSVTVQAIQQASDIPKAIMDVIRTKSDATGGNGIVGEAALDEVLASIGKIVSEVVGLNAVLKDSVFTNLKELSFDAASGLIAASGGFDALNANLASYYENFYSAEEKRAQTITNINKATAGSGLDAATATRESFRTIVEAQDLATESGQKTYAALIGVAGALAGIIPKAEDLAKATAAATAAATAERTDVISARALLAEKEAEALALAADAFKTLTEDVLALRKTLLLAGDAAGYVANEMRLSQLKYTDYMNVGGREGFNASAFNYAYAGEQATAGKAAAESANADALNVQNVGGMLGNSAVYSDALWGPVYIGIRDAIVEASGTVGSYGVRDAVDAFASTLAQMQVKAQYAPQGGGLLGIANARAGAEDANKTSTIGGTLYMGEAAIAYAKAVDNLSGRFKGGSLSAKELTGGLTALEGMFGKLSDLAQTAESVAEAQLAAAQAVVSAGMSSIGYYFGKITESATALAASAETIASPLGQATEAIGRLNSVTTVFAQSASAALSMGGASFQGTDAGAMISKSTLIAEAASIASAVMTTSTAAAAAKKLAESPAFEALSARGIRDASLLLDGLTQYDSASFEKSFLRINNALVTGSVTEDQYQALFSTAIDTFSGLDTETDKVKTAMQSLADAMGSFADDLLISDKTTIGAGQTLAEMQRQYEVAKVSAMTGDATSVSNFKSLANSLLDKSLYANQGDYNSAFGTVYGDARNLESVGVNTLANANSNVVSELKSLNANLSNRVESLEKNLTAALATIAKNTSKTAQGIEQQNTVGLPA